MEIKTNPVIQTEAILKMTVLGRIDAESKKQQIIPVKPIQGVLDIYV